jgi:hypothetical protein
VPPEEIFKESDERIKGSWFRWMPVKTGEEMNPNAARTMSNLPEKTAATIHFENLEFESAFGRDKITWDE